MDEHEFVEVDGWDGSKRVVNRARMSDTGKRMLDHAIADGWARAVERAEMEAELAAHHRVAQAAAWREWAITRTAYVVYYDDGDHKGPPIAVFPSRTLAFQYIQERRYGHHYLYAIEAIPVWDHVPTEKEDQAWQPEQDHTSDSGSDTPRL